jgi:hypothetical protein
MKSTNFRATGLAILGFVLAAFIIVIIVYRTIFGFSTFEDDRYNLGLALRSASPQAQHLLESSLIHVWYEQYQVVRAEDWHRELSVLLLSLWSRIVGAQSQALLRIPHLIWIAAWLSLATILLFKVIREKFNIWILVLLLYTFIANPWSYDVIVRAFLGDVAAAVFILAALFILITRPVLRIPHLLLAGVCCALAYASRDLYLLWVPLTMLILAVFALLGQGTPDGAKQALKAKARVAVRYIVFFAIGFLAIASIKLIWTWREEGSPLANPLQYWMISNYYSSRNDSAHYPYYLYGDKTYGDRIALAGGVIPAIRNLFGRTTLDVLDALYAFNGAWIPLLLMLAMLATLGAFHWTDQHIRIAVALGLCLFTYIVFFEIGLGESIQLRYWLVPATLAIVLAVASFWTLVNNVKRPLVVIIPLVCWVVVAYNPAIKDIAIGRFGVSAPITDQAMADVSADTPNNSTVMFDDIQVGIFYWSNYPLAKVVNMPAGHLSQLDSDKLKSFLDTYQVNIVASDNSNTVTRIEALGFTEVKNDAGVHILTRS